jgi:hypothetical protein
MKKLFLLLSLAVIFISAHAQAPVNDEPCGALPLSILESADACTPASLSITNATYSNLAIPISCGSSEDVWFKFTPASGVNKIFLHKESLANEYFIETFTAGVCNGTFTTVNSCIHLSTDGDYELLVVPAQINYLRLYKYDGGNNYPNFTINICLFSGLPPATNKVGINTKFPNANLDIAGNVRVRDSINIKNIIITGNFKLNSGLAGANKVLTSNANGFATWQNLPSSANTWNVSGSNILNNNSGYVGIGTITPTSKLNVNGQITIDQYNAGGYGGLLIKGNTPGSNYPNIGFSVKNTFNTDVVGAMIQGELASNTVASEAINLGFYTTDAGFGSLSQKMVIMGNGNVGLGGTPFYKLHLGNAANGLRIEGPTTGGTNATALSIGGTGDIAIDKPGIVGGRLTIKENGNVGIGNNNPNTVLSFAPNLGKKITLYPGTTGDVGFAVAGNRLQIYSDNPNADVAIGYDAAGTFNEKFAVKPNGALAVNGSTGSTKQILVSNGSLSPASWEVASNLIQSGASPEYINSNNPLSSTVFSNFTAANYTIILTVPSRVVLTYKTDTYKLCQNTQLECMAKWDLRISLNGNIVGGYTVVATSASGTSFTSGTYGPDYFDLPAGTHTFTFGGISRYNIPEVYKFRAYSTIIPQ